MITLLTGKPGSGKTYKAVYYIHQIIYVLKKVLFKYIYTNINDFQFERVNNYCKRNKRELELLPFDFNALKIHLNALYKMKDDGDQVLIDYCEEHKLLHASFVIDEAHNFFDNQDKVLVWWLSYHRHLYQDIILITQNKTLINTKYRNFPELFTQALPSSHRMFHSKLRYKDFADFAMSKRELISNYSFKLDDEIFSLYHSGKSDKPKLFFYKLIAGIVGFIFVMFAVLYMFMQYKLPDEVVDSVASENVESNNVVDRGSSVRPSSMEFSSDTRNIRLVCDFNECSYQLGGNRALYPSQYLYVVLGHVDHKILYKRYLLKIGDEVDNIKELYIKLSLNDLKEYLPDYYYLRPDLQNNYESNMQDNTLANVDILTDNGANEANDL